MFNIVLGALLTASRWMGLGWKPEWWMSFGFIRFSRSSRVGILAANIVPYNWKTNLAIRNNVYPFMQCIVKSCSEHPYYSLDSSVIRTLYCELEGQRLCPHLKWPSFCVMIYNRQCTVWFSLSKLKPVWRYNVHVVACGVKSGYIYRTSINVGYAKAKMTTI